MFDKILPVGAEAYPGSKGWGFTQMPLFSREFDKVAQDIFFPPEIAEFMKTAKPSPDGVYVLVTALGEEGAWGPNANGDGFDESALTGRGTSAWMRKLSEAAGYKQPAEWGLRTYLKHGGIYRNHDNKDPRKSMGKICVAAYNEVMKRGELINYIKRAAAPDIVEGIDAGVMFPWSMGARVTHDVCSIPGCHNTAPNRAHYCKHAKYEMRRMYPDGKLAFVHNPWPTFFDDSVVTRPADRSAWTHRKVASNFDSADWRREFILPVPPKPKTAKHKVADIEKYVPAQQAGGDSSGHISPEVLQVLKQLIDHDQATAPDMPEGPRRALKSAPAGDAVNALTALGLICKPNETDDIFGGRELPSAVAPDKAPLDLLKALAPMVPGRSMVGPHVVRRIAIIMNVAPEDRETPPVGGEKHARYLRLISQTDVDALERARKDPKVCLAADELALLPTLLGEVDRMGYVPFSVAVRPRR